MSRQIFPLIHAAILRLIRGLHASGLKFHRPTFLALVLMSFAGLAHAEWRSELYPADWSPSNLGEFETDKLIQDFSYAGYHRGEEPAAPTSWPVFNVIDYGADPTGEQDSTAAIQAAIDAAASSGAGIVSLPEGTFKIAPPEGRDATLLIEHGNIVLRGAGSDRTFLFNDTYRMRLKSIIRVQGGSVDWRTPPDRSPVIAITEDLLSPTAQIPLETTEGLKVDDWIILRVDATEDFIKEHHMTDGWGGMGKRLGGVMFQRKILEIDSTNNQITIDVPIRYYLKTRDNARAHLAGPHIEEVGIENLSIGNVEHPLTTEPEGWGLVDFHKEGTPAYDLHATAAITFHHVRNGWISDVSSYHPAENETLTHILSNGVVLDECRGITVQNCDFEHSNYGGGGGNGYMYRIQYSNECLIRDCVSSDSRHGFVIAGMTSSGNVMLNNLARNTQIQVAGDGKTGGKGSDHHMYLSQSNLVDSCTLDGDFFDAHYRPYGKMFNTPEHGVTAAHSVFWNLKGISYHPGYDYVVHSDQSRYGYVIGTSGQVSAVSTSGLKPDRTAPIDVVEGVGEGDTLEPQSLYADQLVRRRDRQGSEPPNTP